MNYLYLITGLALVVSFIVNRQKTFKALKIAFRKIIKILPAFFMMLILVSIFLFLIPDHIILKYLGNHNMFVATIIASVLGSIALMPGFIAFPLCGILLNKGVAYMVLSAFTTTLMMVGVLTSPVEKEYFGVKVTVLRNITSFIIALVVALATGLFFGELL